VKLWQKIGLAVGGVLALFTVAKPKGDGVPSGDDDDDATPKDPIMTDAQPKPYNGIAFAVGDHPTWPLLTAHKRGREVPYLDTAGKMHGNGSRRFGAHRKGPPAHAHHGIDLYATVGDPVVATEPGTISGLWKTFHLGTGAVVLVTDSGLTLVYGEIGPDTWKQFGLAKGQRVVRGQRLATVQPNNAGTFMLHLEIYAGAFATNDPPTSALLDPTVYLLEARANEVIA
jgi:murein DD-endopeptidase MepM/ murein hydrolase activator NlpD